jgi:hypothetical protein
MTRAEIVEAYGITEDGMIEALGKFEAEMCYAPYFYDRAMDSGANEEIEEDGLTFFLFNVTEEDIAQFPELEGVERIRCYETDDGFFYCQDDTDYQARAGGEDE